MTDGSTSRCERNRNRRERRVQKRLTLTQQALDVVNPNAAAIDLGSREHYVAVPEDRDPEPVRHFGCFTRELRQMATWLKACVSRRWRWKPRGFIGCRFTIFWRTRDSRLF